MLDHSQGSPRAIVRRVREQAERGEGHPGHHDLQLVDAVSEAPAAGGYEPLDRGVPTLRVDTTAGDVGAEGDADGCAPSFAQAVAVIRRWADNPA